MAPNKPTQGDHASSAAPTSSAAAATPATSASGSSTAYPFPYGSVFTDGRPLPRLVVFDLDYTLWPFWVDTHVVPPLKLVPAATVTGSAGLRSASGRDRAVPTGEVVVDCVAEPFGFYQDVPDILQALPAAGLRMGVASRTSAPELARDLLRLLKVPVVGGAGSSSGGGSSLLPFGRKDKDKDTPKTRKALDVFDAGLEIYPSNKLRHMEALHRRTGIPYEEMLFFDDESRNRNVETLGVTMWLVRDGVAWGEVERGVTEWRKRRGHGR